MPETPHLSAASPDEIAETLAFALRYDGRKRVYHADAMMARITAGRLLRHLESSDFVVMTAPPAVAQTTSNVMTLNQGKPSDRLPGSNG
jgi:hypothetical protein